ncbi:hypothetical protein N7510_002367 [Penicillium lagena]|uniref:uncharacterized protein n=1 Tax=Penicillium lagena TaxID=94218 RepID=UPI0025414F4C|nr:uncharacterized protein N7510_002367 [Penicillium lagena]KAJ5626058.1 hypothetical protein N7510_002367 [Penicillium lagena]
MLEKTCAGPGERALRPLGSDCVAPYRHVDRVRGPSGHGHWAVVSGTWRSPASAMTSADQEFPVASILLETEFPRHFEKIVPSCTDLLIPHRLIALQGRSPQSYGCRRHCRVHHPKCLDGAIRSRSGDM